ncbi:MAG: efflux transporter outer membrane subunit [Verrucomicrobiales bacterium]|nr:efflux transporter outer membrane subunit [Verrucomicrobiales bacterium]MCP5525878.1 efflux transporter outer membrane subunit [Verrucomicrobiales bacterium]
MLGVVWLTGCALKQEPTREENIRAALPETTQIPGRWTMEEVNTGQVDDGWIASFGDPELEALVDEVIAHNLNLQVAGGRVERAEGTLRLVQAGLLPAVGVGAEVSGVGGTEINARTTRQAGVAVAWEADVWGRVRSGVAAAQDSLEAARADYNAARLSLAGQTAKAWFLAQELRMQVRFAEETVEVLERLTALTRKNFQVGTLSREDVFLVEANLAAAQDAVRQVRIAETQIQRAVELLLGRYPSASLETSGTLVATPPPIPVGMPSELLERRPDLVAAERRVAASFRLEQQARLARLPRFTISAGLSGATSLAGIVGDLAAGLAAPVYAPALSAQIAIASADQQIALSAYGAAVLRALEEVETALFNDHIFSEREQFVAAQAESNRRAFEILRKQLETGKISALPVLQVQAQYVGAQIVLTRLRNQRLAQRVDLHLALGGSF